jgi:hypothetical protein
MLSERLAKGKISRLRGADTFRTGPPPTPCAPGRADLCRRLVAELVAVSGTQGDIIFPRRQVNGRSTSAHDAWIYGQRTRS